MAERTQEEETFSKVKTSQSPIDLGRIDHEFPPILVLYHPSTRQLAEKIVLKTNSEEDKGKLNCRRVIMKSNVQWGCFRDGWPNVFIDNVTDIAGRDVIFVASLHSPDLVLFEQLALIYMLPRYLIRSLRVILPFFPTGTMERVDNEGQIPTAKTLAHMLSVIPMAARGPVQLVMFDIHALQERFYFSHQVIPRLLSAIPLLIETLRDHPQRDSIRIVFPDEGAHKRFHSFFPKQWPTVTCIKVRDGDRRVVKIKEGDPKDGYVVIVDDLVQTGGTLMECAKACMSQGATSVSAFVTHAVFPEESWRRFTPGQSSVAWDTFWITDSIPHAHQICENSPFRMISVSDAIVQSLLSYDLLKDRQ